MKKILAVLGLALLLLIAILCVRASLVKSRQVQAPLVTDLTLAGGTDTKHYLPCQERKRT
ncbi:MAG: hypothetical protein QOF89_5932 [Acidobacteriota bacterium]|jgi:hypothetical protein|nr:hypothetical protein [Acidobacteriota bacterium]